jgi:hypothetical protein
MKRKIAILATRVISETAQISAIDLLKDKVSRHCLLIGFLLMATIEAQIIKLCKRHHRKCHH